MPQSISDIVQDWLRQSKQDDGDVTMYDVVHDEPETAWSAILQILGRGLSEDQTSVLAAGPLESLLVLHGPEFIDRVESEAVRTPDFGRLLSGVWQNGMSQEIWDRVRRARGDVSCN